ncbi:MAG: ATP-binding cassette domain-containing protein [Candidatus Aenigmarchaeota archaeon]|nr:ATP-binding cassette domain-containing protein [Candidatus Aenigmarchaeota archaeon]
MRAMNCSKIFSCTNVNKVAIRFSNVWFSYAGESFSLKNINLKINEGECIGIIGPNGSGKTTLAKHMIGLLRPSRGDVFIYEMNTKKTAISDLARAVGYVFQNPDNQLLMSSVKEEISFGPKNLGLNNENIKQRIKEVIREFGLEQLEDRHPLSLSVGQRQLVAIASVLAMDPKIVIFDEPTSAQDFVTYSWIMKVVNKLREQGRTVILITHHMPTVAQYASRVLVMHQGKIVLDESPRKVFTKSKLGKYNIKPPPITILANLLSSYGIPRNILTVEEMCKVILPKVRVHET